MQFAGEFAKKATPEIKTGNEINEMRGKFLDIFYPNSMPELI